MERETRKRIKVLKKMQKEFIAKKDDLVEVLEQLYEKDLITTHIDIEKITDEISRLSGLIEETETTILELKGIEL